MDSHSLAPPRAGDGDVPIDSLRTKRDRIIHASVGQDFKRAFFRDIWPALQGEYDFMMRSLKEFCENVLKDKGIACQVSGRTKAVNSIQKSLDRREKARGEHNPLESLSDIFYEIHDLVGLRIILDFPDDMERTVRFIIDEFREEKPPAIFRPDREVGQFWRTWFGAYQTRNYRLSLEDGKCGTLSQFCGVMFEIQVTTIAEDLYNKLAHQLLYKGSSGPHTRQDEIVMDMAHGLALCYTLCLTYMKEKLGKVDGKDKSLPATKIPEFQAASSIVQNGSRFYESLIRGAYFDATPPHGLSQDSRQGLPKKLQIPPEGCNSVNDLSFWINAKITGILDEIRSSSQTIRDAVLSKLPIANDAAFNSHANEHGALCHPDTRVDLLQEITIWADDSRGECIFWLNGMAGTGKSTISRTVAQSFADKGILGASFFFKRGERDRGNAALLFPTIASQLVIKEPALAAHIRAAIDADPHIADKPLKEQFNKLVLEPLGKLKGDPSRVKTFTLVLDALDECDNVLDIRLIIYLLSKVKTLRSVRLRVFVTSRPELPIRLGFAKMDGDYHDLVLHEIAPPIIERDIAAFLRSRFAEIRDDHNDLYGGSSQELPLEWPGPEVVQALVDMAVPLFIFAATVCRFIQESGCNPRQQLAKVLQYQSRIHQSEMDKLDATYRPVLDQLLVGCSESKRFVVARFRAVVGSIVLLAEPLSIRSLARLLDIPEGTVFYQLQPLHSVLRVPASADFESPIRTFHLSFRDFLVDPYKANEQDQYPFWVDERQTHECLATRCLELLLTDGKLKKDICGLRLPGTCRSEIDQKVIDTNLPRDVQYACRYWVYHWKESRCLICDGDLVGRFLTRHLLHWLEALGLLGWISESIGMVNDLLGLLDVKASDKISAFLFDSKRVIRSHCSIIDTSPLQVYSSAIVFAPEKSVVRETFRHQIPAWLALPPKVDSDWDSCIQTLEGHSSGVNSVAFSHDSKTLASASNDKTIKLWDTATGAYRATLKGHSSAVYSVAFSYNSKTLASASFDKTIKLWDTATGACMATLKGHSREVSSVAFSHNSKTLASASSDKTIKLWDTATGAYRATLEGHSREVYSVAFSHDLKTLASASSDKTIKLWDTATSACRATLEGHSNWVNSVAFSHDSKTLASASNDETIKLWDTATGACRATLEGHSREVNSVAFSHDSKTLASASSDKTIKLWDTATGAYRATLEGHSSGVNSVAFSHDSKTLASASNDETIKLWDTATGACRATLEGHSDWVYSVAFSHDSTSSSLSTDVGTFTLNDLSLSPTASTAALALKVSKAGPGSLPQYVNRRGIGLSEDKTWITWDSYDVLWLPQTYRPGRSGIAAGRRLAIGCPSGRVLLLEFSSDTAFS